MYVSYMSGIFDFTGVCLHCPIELIRTLRTLGGASCAPCQQLPTLSLSLPPSRGDLSPPPPSLSFLLLPCLLLPSLLPPFLYLSLPLSRPFPLPGTQMVLTMKLTSFAYNLYDGTADRKNVFAVHDDKKKIKIYADRKLVLFCIVFIRFFLNLF
jgi:hypothetical protein